MNFMINIEVNENDYMVVRRTLTKFMNESFVISTLGIPVVSEERMIQFVKLKECLRKEKNKQFLIENLVNKGEKDPFTRVSQAEASYNALSSDFFVMLLSGQSLTNRVVKACENKKISNDLVNRLRQCIWVFFYVSDEFALETNVDN